MKKIFIALFALAALTGCYEDYVKDFDYSTAYFTYQYDVRTVLPGEIESVNLTVGMGGVITNQRDRDLTVAVNNDLLTANLNQFGPVDADGVPTAEKCYAIEVFKSGASSVGSTFSSASADFHAYSGIDELKPMPEEYYKVDLKGMQIKAGNHTASAPIKFNSTYFEDENAYKPAYALGFEMKKADVDSLLSGKNFSIICFKCDNKFYGNWYYGGEYTCDGETVKYPFAIPQLDDQVYTLTTVNASTVKTDKYLQNKGSLFLTFNGNDITITSDDINLIDDGRKSYFNNSKLLQDRELHLNYSFIDAGGKKYEVSDVLYFRDRKRDGCYEWMDENTEHYN